MKIADKEFNLSVEISGKGKIVKREEIIKQNKDFTMMLFMWYGKDFSINATVSKVDMNLEEEGVVDYGVAIMLENNKEEVKLLFKTKEENKFLNRYITCFSAKTMDFLQVYVYFLDKLICFSAELPKDSGIKVKNYARNKYYKMIDKIIKSIHTFNK
ncbi:MAG: hypothetical protein AB7S44_03585 [Spirochaetales bacterium]